jgi:hypothetical protein
MRIRPQTVPTCDRLPDTDIESNELTEHDAAKWLDYNGYDLPVWKRLAALDLTTAHRHI